MSNLYTSKLLAAVALCATTVLTTSFTASEARAEENKDSFTCSCGVTSFAITGDHLVNKCIYDKTFENQSDAIKDCEKMERLYNYGDLGGNQPDVSFSYPGLGSQSTISLHLPKSLDNTVVAQLAGRLSQVHCGVMECALPGTQTGGGLTPAQTDSVISEVTSKLLN